MKEGEKGQKVSVEGRGLFGTSTDWQMRVDLRQRIEFPQQTTVTKKRPEIIIWSLATKQAILLELTVPWEDKIDDAHELKS